MRLSTTSLSGFETPIYPDAFRCSDAIRRSSRGIIAATTDTGPATTYARAATCWSTAPFTSIPGSGNSAPPVSTSPGRPFASLIRPCSRRPAGF